jgi:ribosomal protein S8
VIEGRTHCTVPAGGVESSPGLFIIALKTGYDLKVGEEILCASTMSLVNLAHVCSHLQNASKARLGLTSIPESKLHLKLMLAMQNQGFLSTVVRGGTQPPPAHNILSHPSSNTGGAEIEKITRANVATRRLWLGMKYWQSEPVLEKMELISKPTRRIWLDVESLKKLVLGKDSGYVKGLTRPGECLFVSTDKGIFEARECVERKIGGQLLCRVR